MMLVLGILVMSALLLAELVRMPRMPAPGEPDGRATVYPADGQRSSSESKQLRVTVHMKEAEYRSLEEANRLFMMKYPAVQVHLSNEAEQSNSPEVYSLWKREAELGISQDIMLMDNSWVREFAALGYLSPVDSLTTGDVPGDLSESLLDVLRWNGYLWAMPMDLDPYVPIWNKKLLALESGGQLPGSWEQYTQLLEETAARHKTINLLQLTPGRLEELMLWLRQYEAETKTTRSYGPADGLGLLHSETQDKLLYLASISQRISRLDAPMQLLSALQEGELLSAFVPWSNYSSWTTQLDELVQLDLSRIEPYRHSGRSYAISSRSVAVEEALLWVQEMTDTLKQQQAYQVNRMLPARLSAYQPVAGSGIEEAQLPPTWWVNVLKGRAAKPEVPGPGWADAWMKREVQYRAYSVESWDFTAFTNALLDEKAEDAD